MVLGAIAAGYLAAPSFTSLTNDIRDLYNFVRCGSSTCVVTVPTTHAASYDQQIAFIYGQDYSSLSTTVVMVEQNDTDGFGPSYLLNGYSNAGWWYQVGVSYNWPTSTGTSYAPGVHFAWEVFAPNGTTTSPLLTSFSGVVNPNDSITLSISFSGSNVVMAARDVNTGAFASHSYNAFGANIFNGGRSSSKFFTGLMTEWYHGDPKYTTMSKVAYTGQSVSSAWVCIDEFVASNHQLIYGQCSLQMTLTSTPQTYSYVPPGYSSGLNTSATISEFDSGPSP